jgi:hypothetical protein
MKQWKAWICLLVFCMGLITETLPPVQAAVVDTSDEAYLLMIAATARLSDEEPIIAQQPNTMQMVSMQVPQQKLGINEYKTLSDFYLNFAANLPAGHPLVAHFTNKSLDNLEQAQKLDRARRRRNNPFRRFFRAITWPALKIARGIGWSIRKGVEYLNEVGPQIIQEMLKGYITTGTPFTARAFWKAVGQRIKKALINEAEAKMAAALTGNQSANTNEDNEEPAKSTATPQQEKATRTPSDEERAYGKWKVTISMCEQLETCYYGVENMYTDYPHDYHHSNFYDWAGATGYIYEISIPLVINLDAGSINSTFKGNGSAPEEVFVYERSTAYYTANFTDVWIHPTSDGLAWEIGGSITVDLHVDDELRSWYNPDDPLVAGYYVWFPNTAEETFQVPIEGLIYEEMDSGSMKMEMLIGLESTDKPDYSFMLENLEISLPQDFPLP